ncbi:MAG: hypothetical protein AABO57_04655 [Acidobacteriota bacterium]
MANKIKRDQAWVEAKRRCQLNQDDIRKAKELGLNPRKLIKNIPSKSQQWKAPVKYWVRDLYEKQQRKIGARKPSKVHNPSPAPSESASRLSEAIPTEPDFLFDDDSIPADLDFLFDDESIPVDADFLADDDSIPF